MEMQTEQQLLLLQEVLLDILMLGLLLLVVDKVLQQLQDLMP